MLCGKSHKRVPLLFLLQVLSSFPFLVCLLSFVVIAYFLKEAKNSYDGKKENLEKKYWKLLRFIFRYITYAMMIRQSQCYIHREKIFLWEFSSSNNCFHIKSMHGCCVESNKNFLLKFNFFIPFFLVLLQNARPLRWLTNILRGLI